MRRGWCFVVTLLASSAALAEDPAPEGMRLQAGVRYWVNTGSTQRSHDASSANPLLLNPTSTLIYDNLDANVLELYARKGFGENWFVKGNLGLGTVNTGTFTDRDFFLSGGRAVVTQTVSAVSGKLNYVTADIGREVARRGNSTFTVFAGYQQWIEKLDSHGFSDSFGTLGLPDSVLAISNDLTWRSLRAGGEWRAVRGRTRFHVDVAAIPYAKYRNEDSHHLRQSPNDLGPVPNIIATGTGWGMQAEAEIRRSYPDLWGLEFAIGYRYWRMESASGNQEQAGRSFPIVDLVSERHGATFSVSKNW